MARRKQRLLPERPDGATQEAPDTARPRAPERSRAPAPSGAEAVRALQRQIGNRAAARLLVPAPGVGGALRVPPPAAAERRARAARAPSLSRAPSPRRVQPEHPGTVAPTVQRLKDEKDQEITEERIARENDPGVLKAWLSIEAEDWEDEALHELIRDRLGVLQPTRVEPKQQEKEPEKVAPPEKPEPDPLEEARALLRPIPRHEQVAFFRVCDDEMLDPTRILKGLDGAATSALAFKRAVGFFAAGANFASALRLAATYQGLVDLRMNTISADLVSESVQQGLITIVKVTYCDTPLKSGSVYWFSIVGTRDRIVPEWHVHWAPQNKVSAASFKDVRTKIGKGARVTTSATDNAKMKQVIGSAWGP